MFTLPELPYEVGALEPHIDRTTMEIHHGKHHATYVKNLNDTLALHEKFLVMDIEELLKNLSLVPEEVRAKVRNNAGGHYNHSLFWQMLIPGGSPLEGPLSDAISSTFGGQGELLLKLKEAGLNRFGSGWAWLVSDKGVLSVESTPNQDSPVMDGKQVLLGVDVWEHAYYLKYQNRRADYLEAWKNVINWKFVAERFAAK